MFLNRQFKLFKMFPNKVEVGIGVLNIDKNRIACFYEGQAESDGNSSELLGMMARVEIDTASGHGIMLSGIECVGREAQNIYQQWWLAYV